MSIANELDNLLLLVVKGRERVKEQSNPLGDSATISLFRSDWNTDLLIVALQIRKSVERERTFAN